MVLVQPVGEPLEALELALVHLGVAVGVVADEHLGEVGVELLDVRAEVLAVLEVELVLPALLDRHRELEPVVLGGLGNPGGLAELLVDECAGHGRVGPALQRGFEALVDEMLAVRDRLRLLGRGVSLDPEPLLLERPAVVERQDVQLAVVAQSHRSVAPPSTCLPFAGQGYRGGGPGYACAATEQRFTGPSYTIGIEEELMILDADTLDLANMIEPMLEAAQSDELAGEVKPELMESVLEIATTPCTTTVEACEQLRGLRDRVRQTAEGKGLAIGSAGTHPFAMWEDQRIVARPRY